MKNQEVMGIQQRGFGTCLNNQIPFVNKSLAMHLKPSSSIDKPSPKL